MPKVSIIVATYNRVALVMETIASIQAQTFRDFELIVVDDGSTDATPEMLGALKREMPELRVVRQPNRGRNCARNAGLALALGEYIVFFDDDDLFEPQRLERQAGFLDEHLEAGVVYSDMYVCDASGALMGRVSEFRHRPPPRGFIYDELLPYNQITFPTVMIRKTALAAVGAFDEALKSQGEDWVLWLKLAARYPFVYLEEPVAKYRLHLAMTSSAQSLSQVVAVRETICHSPAFTAASPLARARFFATYGRILISAGHRSNGWRKLAQSIRLAPWRLQPYTMLAASLFGRRAFTGMLEGKRHLTRLFHHRPDSPLPEVW